MSVPVPPRATPSRAVASRSDSLWVCADPFRAHLRALCAGSHLPWQIVALHSGLTLAEADGLLHGRRGRRMRLLARRSAQRLITTTHATVATIPNRWVSAAPTARRLSDLVAHGVALEPLAHRLGCTPQFLADLTDQEEPATGQVSELIALGVLAARESLNRVLRGGRPGRLLPQAA